MARDNDTGSDPQPVTEHLTEQECWRLMAAADFGRLATAVLSGATGELAVDIVPINFLLRDGEIVFRSGPGSKLKNITANHRVAFETDGLVDGRYWSVVVHGTAKRMAFDPDIEQSGVLELVAAHPTTKWNYVRITAESVTGIRFHRS